MQILCHGLHSQQISTQLNTFGRFWSNVLDRALSLHHNRQNTKWRNFFCMVHPISSVHVLGDLDISINAYWCIPVPLEPSLSLCSTSETRWKWSEQAAEKQVHCGLIDLHQLADVVSKMKVLGGSRLLWPWHIRMLMCLCDCPEAKWEFMIHADMPGWRSERHRTIGTLLACSGLDHLHKAATGSIKPRKSLSD